MPRTIRSTERTPAQETTGSIAHWKRGRERDGETARVGERSVKSIIIETFIHRISGISVTLAVQNSPFLRSSSRVTTDSVTLFRSGGKNKSNLL